MRTRTVDRYILCIIELYRQSLLEKSASIGLSLTFWKRVNTRIIKHLWNEQETKIATLGFSIGVDPTNFIKEDYENRMLKTIASRTQRPDKKIPRFQCSFSSPYDIDQDENIRISTKTYALECRQKDAKDLKKLLEARYKDGTFMFFKVRHINP